jgi:hypothetical protein
MRRNTDAKGLRGKEKHPILYFAFSLSSLCELYFFLAQGIKLAADVQIIQNE